MALRWADSPSPRGPKVMVSQHAIMRDAAAWPRPEVFIPGGRFVALPMATRGEGVYLRVVRLCAIIRGGEWRPDEMNSIPIFG